MPFPVLYVMSWHILWCLHDLKLSPLGIWWNPAGGFHTCGVMSVVFIFLYISSSVFPYLSPPSTCSVLSCIWYLLSCLVLICCACHRIVLIRAYINSSMCIDSSLMLSTYDWPLVNFISIWRTAHWNRYSGGLKILLSLSIMQCPIISIRCDIMSAHVWFLCRHHKAIPYGSRGQYTKLSFSHF